MHPILVQMGVVSLPVFGVLAACGLMLGLALSQRTAALAGVDADRLWDAGLFMLLAAFVLSRGLLVAGHFRTFLAYPVLLLAVPSLTATGLLLTAVATAVWFYFRRIPLLAALDAWAPCAAVVWMFLALGHYFEGSDPGMPTAVAWGVRMPGEDFRQHPVGIYAAVVALGLAMGLYGLLRRPHRRGVVGAWGLMGVGLGQFLLSFVRQPGVVTVGGLDVVEVVGVGMMVVGGGLWVGVRSGGTFAGADVGPP